MIVYWRDPAPDREVDIIVRNPKYVFPVEVKYQENPSFKAGSGMGSFCRLEQVTKAYWVTKHDRDFDVIRVEGMETSFLRVPAHILCYLLGQAERLLWT